MKEYIERMKAVSVIKSYEFEHCPEYMQDWATKLKRAILDDLTDDMMETPAADVEERKRGRWVGSAQDFSCSACGVYQNLYTGRTNFCPNCGADMREVDHAVD